MKSQISRHSHAADKHYSGVYQQQGRMITDADWNEWVDLLKARLQQTLAEVVGSGAPRDGGLALMADLKLRPGTLYVNGQRGQVAGSTPLSFTDQPDFPLAPALPASGEQLVYADLWDRHVDALADPGLLDPGLHGADTTTRTQTLLQLKWCPASLQPLDPQTNPAQGDARFKLLPADSGDVGDDGPPRIGNSLFRVEVHEAQKTGANTLRLTLKWSGENGAEQQTLRSRDSSGTEQLDYLHLPPEFSTGSWTFEIFNAASEKHLGVHLATGFVPVRGTLNPFTDAQNQPTHEFQEQQTPPAVGGLPAEHIRRWDGHLTLDLERANPAQPWKPAANALVNGWDKGEALRGVSGTPTQHGDLSWAGGAFSLRLEHFVLSLLPGALNFVPGDHWLAQVREDGAWWPQANPPVDERVQMLAGGAPLGVRHHCAVIGRVKDGRLVPVAAGSAEERRLAFAPLTDIHAGQVHWQAPACTSADAVRGRLPLLLATTQADTTVELVLRALLCELDAGTLPYDRSATDLKSVKDLLVKKTGDTMTGPLSVVGTVTASGLKLATNPSPLAGAVLVSSDSAGNAEWRALADNAWKLVDDPLSQAVGVKDVLKVDQVVRVLLLDVPEGVFVKHTRDGRTGTRTMEVGDDAVLQTSDLLPNGRIGFPGAGHKHGQLRWVPATARFEFIDSSSGAPSGDFGAAPPGFVGLRAGNCTVEGVLTVNGAAFVVHNKAGGNAVSGLEVGSRDALGTSTAPNGRIGFPGYGIHHGQLRWVPASTTFELIDSTPMSASGDYGVVPLTGFVGLRAGRGEFETSVRIGSVALPGSFSLQGSATVQGNTRLTGTLAVHTRQEANSLAMPVAEPALHVADNGNVGIGTWGSSRARLVVDGDVLVTGRLVQKGETMILSKREFGPIDAQPGTQNNDVSLGGTAFRVDRALPATVSLMVMGVTGTAANQTRLSLWLQPPGGSAESIVDQVSIPSSGVLTVELRRVLSPGLNVLELKCSSINQASSLSVQTVSLIVTALPSGRAADDVPVNTPAL